MTDRLPHPEQAGGEAPRAVLISLQPELTNFVMDGLAGRAQVVDCTNQGRYPSLSEVLEHKPAVCFIDVGSADEALALVHELAGADVPVAALHLNNDSDLILRSFRCGASEFLFTPIGQADMIETFDRLLRKSGSNSMTSKPGKIWTVMPAKPSYGATTISCNLAVRLRQSLRRPVLLADMDPLLGSISFSLKLKSAFSFIDVVNHGSQIDKDLWKKIIVPYEDVDVLLGPEIPRFETPSSSGVPAFLQFARTNYGAVVLDSPGPLSDWHLSLARSADEVLLVTTNELAAVHATLRAIHLLEHAGADRSRLRLIVNRYEKDNGLLREAIETALKLEVFWTLPNDYAPVQKSVLDGKVVSSNCKLGESMDDLVQRLTGVTRFQRKRWTPSLPSFFSRKTL
jgi:pilus assembly protein CpaE